METPVNHWEHTELKELMDAKFEVLQAEDKRLNERLKIVEQQNQQITELSVAVQKQADNISALAKNIESICNLQKAEGERLEHLEENRVSDDAIMESIKKQEERLKSLEMAGYERYKNNKEKAISTAVTVVVTALASAGITIVVMLIRSGLV